MTSEDMPPPLLLTPSAVQKIRELLEEEGDPSLKLRVYVTGGGCSGFQYGFGFQDSPNEDDLQMEKDGVVVLIDPISVQYLSGAEVDYAEDLQEGRFIIRNPNAVTTCGCGSSFSPGY